MRSKRILALALIGVLSIGCAQAFAKVSKNTVPKNKVMTETIVEKTRNKGNKKIVLDAFKKYFNEDVNVNALYERANETFEQGGQELNRIAWCNQKGEYINGNKVIQYESLIDTKTNKIVHLKYHPGEPKSEDYKNFSYDAAKALADRFVKENNLFNGKRYEFLNKKSKEVNSTKEAWDYIFYYKYDEKTCIIKVNKDIKKVVEFILLDEFTSLG